MLSFFLLFNFRGERTYLSHANQRSQLVQKFKFESNFRRRSIMLNFQQTRIKFKISCVIKSIFWIPGRRFAVLHLYDDTTFFPHLVAFQRYLHLQILKSCLIQLCLHYLASNIKKLLNSTLPPLPSFKY